MRGALLLIGAAMALSGAVAQPLTNYQGLGPAGRTEPSASLTLRQALKLVSESNHSLSSARYAAESSEGMVMRARARPNPTLDIEIEDTSRKATRDTRATLSVPVELGGKRGARVAAAELARDAARQEAEQAHADVRAQTVAAFFEVLIAQERVELAARTVEIARDAHRIASRRVEAGKVPPLDADRAQVQLADAELGMAQAGNSLDSARRRLSVLWGNPSPAFTEAEGDLAASLDRPGLDDMGAALEKSPAVRAARLELERSRAQIEVERSKRYSDLAISAGVIRNNEAGRNQMMLGLSVPLPLFDRNQGNIYEASMLAYKSNDDYLGLRAHLQTQLQHMASRFDTAKNAAQRLESEILPIAATAFTRAKIGFEAGKFDFLEVLDAQRTLFQTRAQRLSALSEAHRALAEINRILGRES